MRIKDVQLILLFSLGISYSCTKEDLSDCPRQPGGVTLKYDYSLNMAYADLFGGQVYDLKVFFFDEEGLLCDTLAPAVSAGELKNGWAREVNLAPGNYTIMTWGGDRGFGNSFQFTDRNSRGNGIAGDVTIGQTRLADFRTQLRSVADPGDNERMIPQIQWFNNLFHGVQQAIVVTPKEQTVVATSLIKNTKTVRVKIGKLSVLSNTAPNESDFDIQLIAHNGQYTYSNKPDTDAQAIRYEAGRTIIANDSIRKDITTLRLAGTPGNTPLLTVTYRPTNLFICKDLDVTDLIMRSKIPARDNEGNVIKDSDGKVEMVYPTSEYLDRQDLFEITFEVAEDVNGKLAFTVYINGWKIQNIIPEH